MKATAMRRPAPLKLRFALLGGMVVAIGAGIWFFFWDYDPRCVQSIGFSRATDLGFSPEGKYLAIGGASPFAGQTSRVRVYELDNGKIIFEAAEGTNCAWNLDGTQLAIANDQMTVWKTSDWTLQETLDYGGQGGLCFDERGDLFAVSRLVSDYDSRIEPVLALWNGSTGHLKSPQAVNKDDKESAYGTSAKMRGEDVIVAVSYWGDSPLKILRIHRGAGTEMTSTVEYELPVSDGTQVHLSPGARELAILEVTGFRLFRLAAGKLEPVAARRESIPESRPELRESGNVARWLGQLLDISSDGRFACYAFNNRTEVVRIADGAIVFSKRLPSTAVALSSNGEFLAAAHPSKKKICIYRVTAK